MSPKADGEARSDNADMPQAARSPVQAAAAAADSPQGLAEGPLAACVASGIGSLAAANSALGAFREEMEVELRELACRAQAARAGASLVCQQLRHLASPLLTPPAAAGQLPDATPWYTPSSALPSSPQLSRAGVAAPCAPSAEAGDDDAMQGKDRPGKEGDLWQRLRQVQTQRHLAEAALASQQGAAAAAQAATAASAGEGGHREHSSLWYYAVGSPPSSPAASELGSPEGRPSDEDGGGATPQHGMPCASLAVTPAPPDSFPASPAAHRTKVDSVERDSKRLRARWPQRDQGPGLEEGAGAGGTNDAGVRWQRRGQWQATADGLDVPALSAAEEELAAWRQELSLLRAVVEAEHAALLAVQAARQQAMQVQAASTAAQASGGESDAAAAGSKGETGTGSCQQQQLASMAATIAALEGANLQLRCRLEAEQQGSAVAQAAAQQRVRSLQVDLQRCQAALDGSTGAKSASASASASLAACEEAVEEAAEALQAMEARVVAASGQLMELQAAGSRVAEDIAASLQWRAAVEEEERRCAVQLACLKEDVASVQSDAARSRQQSEAMASEAADRRQDVEQLGAQRAALRAEQEAAQQSLARLQGEVHACEGRLAQLRHEEGALASQLAAARTQLALVAAEMAAADARFKTWQQQAGAGAARSPSAQDAHLASWKELAEAAQAEAAAAKSEAEEARAQLVEVRAQLSAASQAALRVEAVPQADCPPASRPGAEQPQAEALRAEMLQLQQQLATGREELCKVLGEAAAAKAQLSELAVQQEQAVQADAARRHDHDAAAAEAEQAGNLLRQQLAASEQQLRQVQAQAAQAEARLAELAAAIAAGSAQLQQAKEAEEEARQAAAAAAAQAAGAREVRDQLAGSARKLQAACAAGQLELAGVYRDLQEAAAELQAAQQLLLQEQLELEQLGVATSAARQQLAEVAAALPPSHEGLSHLAAALGAASAAASPPGRAAAQHAAQQQMQQVALVSRLQSQVAALRTELRAAKAQAAEAQHQAAEASHRAELLRVEVQAASAEAEAAAAAGASAAEAASAEEESPALQYLQRCQQAEVARRQQELRAEALERQLRKAEAAAAKLQARHQLVLQELALVREQAELGGAAADDGSASAAGASQWGSSTGCSREQEGGEGRAARAEARCMQLQAERAVLQEQLARSEAKLLAAAERAAAAEEAAQAMHLQKKRLLREAKAEAARQVRELAEEACRALAEDNGRLSEWLQSLEPAFHALLAQLQDALGKQHDGGSIIGGGGEEPQAAAAAAARAVRAALAAAASQLASCQAARQAGEQAARLIKTEAHTLRQQLASLMGRLEEAQEGRVAAEVRCGELEAAVDRHRKEAADAAARVAQAGEAEAASAQLVVALQEECDRLQAMHNRLLQQQLAGTPQPSLQQWATPPPAGQLGTAGPTGEQEDPTSVLRADLEAALNAKQRALALTARQAEQIQALTVQLVDQTTARKAAKARPATPPPAEEQGEQRVEDGWLQQVWLSALGLCRQLGLQVPDWGSPEQAQCPGAGSAADVMALLSSAGQAFCSLQADVRALKRLLRRLGEEALGGRAAEQHAPAERLHMRRHASTQTPGKEHSSAGGGNPPGPADTPGIGQCGSSLQEAHLASLRRQGAEQSSVLAHLLAQVERCEAARRQLAGLEAAVAAARAELQRLQPELAAARGAAQAGGQPGQQQQVPDDRNGAPATDAAGKPAAAAPAEARWHCIHELYGPAAPQGPWFSFQLHTGPTCPPGPGQAVPPGSSSTLPAVGMASRMLADHHHNGGDGDGGAQHKLRPPACAASGADSGMGSSAAGLGGSKSRQRAQRAALLGKLRSVRANLLQRQAVLAAATTSAPAPATA